MSPFWIKSFPGHGDDICKDGPGGEKKTTPPSVGTGKKKSPVTLSMVDDGRIFVINNGRVVEDGASLGRLRNAAGATIGTKDNAASLVNNISHFHSLVVYYNNRGLSID